MWHVQHCAKHLVLDRAVLDKHTLHHLACSVRNPKLGQPWYCLQVIQMASLHVLFASLAFLAAARESHRPYLPSSQAGHHSTGPLEAFSTLWHFNEVALDRCSPLCTAHHALQFSSDWFQE